MLYGVPIGGPVLRRGMYHSGPMLQRGLGVGSFFSRLLSRAMPFISKAASVAGKGIKSAVTSKAAKDLGQKILQSGIEGAADVIGGAPLRSTVAEKVEAAKQDIANTLRDTVKQKQQQQESKLTKRRSASSRRRSSSPLMSTARKRVRFRTKWKY